MLTFSKPYASATFWNFKCIAKNFPSVNRFYTYMSVLKKCFGKWFKGIALWDWDRLDIVWMDVIYIRRWNSDNFSKWSAASWFKVFQRYWKTIAFFSFNALALLKIFESVTATIIQICYKMSEGTGNFDNKKYLTEGCYLSLEQLTEGIG